MAQITSFLLSFTVLTINKERITIIDKGIKLISPAGLYDTQKKYPCT